MVATTGLVGLRPAVDAAVEVACPPYDVIKEGSPLEARLNARSRSLFHVILGDAPGEAMKQLVAEGALERDDEAAYYVYEQSWGGGARTGVFVAAEVSDYAERQIIRHEKTFDEKVKGRIALARETGHNIGPVFLLTRGALSDAFAPAKEAAPLYDFVSRFGGGTDLEGVRNRVWRVPEQSAVGVAIEEVLAPEALYIADGHHRYHAALRGGQTHVLAYVTEEAKILAYNRVVTGVRPFAEARRELELEPAEAFTTPEKHGFRLYSKDGCWTLRAKHVPDDVVGRLDCAILERELYPHLGLEHRHIAMPKHFDYYPESALDEMQDVVDAGRYELAIALHPVAIRELVAVADAGLDDPEIVMPEKSTFFSPKILTGLVLYRHQYET